MAPFKRGKLRLCTLICTKNVQPNLHAHIHATTLHLPGTLYIVNRLTHEVARQTSVHGKGLLRVLCQRYRDVVEHNVPCWGSTMAILTIQYTCYESLQRVLELVSRSESLLQVAVWRQKRGQTRRHPRWGGVEDVEGLVNLAH